MTTTLPSQARAELERDLRTGETVLWAAQPLPRLRLRRSLTPLTLGLLCVVFASVVEPLAVLGMRAGAAPFDTAVRLLLPLPFGFVGLQVILTVVGQVRDAGRSVTALTDHRIVEVTWGGRRTVTSSCLGSMMRITRDQTSDGAGDLTISFRTDDQTRENPTATLRSLPGVEELERLLTREVSRYRDPMYGPH